MQHPKDVVALILYFISAFSQTSGFYDKLATLDEHHLWVIRSLFRVEKKKKKIML